MGLFGAAHGRGRHKGPPPLGDGLRDHLRDAPWEDIFKLSASAAASDVCEWVQVGIDVYIPHRKYQVKPHSSPWFSAACAAAIVHRPTE